MKKLMSILVMGLCGTAVFAQDATIVNEQKERPGAVKKDSTVVVQDPSKGGRTLTVEKDARVQRKLAVMHQPVMIKTETPADEHVKVEMQSEKK